jgi:DNA polymerase III delta prime subunit
MVEMQNPAVVLPSTAARLDDWKKRLYDFTRRNRLLFFRVSKSSVLRILDPDPDSLFEMLVRGGRSLRVDSELAASLDPKFWDRTEVATVAPTPGTRTRSSLIKTPHEQPDLRRILNNLARRARSTQEEQGIHVLYAVFGMLRWRETSYSDYTKAPLLLVPVHLLRDSPGSPYHLTLAEEDITSNPTLKEYLRQAFGIDLPDWLTFTDDAADPSATTWRDWLSAVRAQIETQPGWEIETNETFVSILSYQRQIIVDDLETNRELVGTHPVIRLMGDPSARLPDNTVDAIKPKELDDKVPLEHIYQVLDADSSQQEAIEGAKRGVSLVLHGPPGTGKSQTIANIIAEFLAAGKRVLFVSAKMAALEVVQHRLEEVSLDRYCLQVHSHKRNKLDVIRELDEALENSDAVSVADGQVLRELSVVRQALNDYPRALHLKRFPIQMSSFDAYGILARLRETQDMRFTLPDLAFILPDAENQRRDWVLNTTILAAPIHDPAIHPWAGCQIPEYTLDVHEQVEDDLANMHRLLDHAQALAQNLATDWGVPCPPTPTDAHAMARLSAHYHVDLLDLPLDQLLRRYQSTYTSFWRRLSSAYRADKASVRAVAYDKPRRRADIASDLERAIDVAQWAGRTHPENNPPPARKQAREMLDLLKSFWEAVVRFARYFEPEWSLAGDSPAASTWGQLAQRIERYQQALPLLGEWISYTSAVSRGPEMNLPTFVAEAAALGIAPSDWFDAYQKRFARLFLGKVTQAVPSLKEFHSAIHTQNIRRFREADQAQLRLNRQRVRARVAESYPRNGADDIPGGEAAILRREARKKRRVMSLRRLFQRIPNLIPALKPCLMMSPLTVSQFLDPNLYRFDLLIFDEASQLRPEECVCAISRAKQVIVAGDDKQLPPTSFFESLDPSEDYDEDREEHMLDSLPSILSESETLLPSFYLKWHYRSRDEMLIAFSNKHFYDGKLYTFPAPGTATGPKGNQVCACR